MGGGAVNWDVQIECASHDGAVVRVVGVIDTETASGIEQTLHDKTPTATGQPIHVLLDLASVVFVDLSGLDALLRFQNSIESGGGTVGLLDPTPAVLWLLHETHLDGASETMLTTSTDPDSAAAEVR